MGDSLRQALIDDHVIADIFADDILTAFADWLDRRAKEMVVGSAADNNTATAIRYVKAAALENVRDEIRQEIRDAT